MSDEDEDGKSGTEATYRFRRSSSPDYSEVYIPAKNVSTTSEFPGTGCDVAGDLDVTQDLNETLILNQDDEEGNSDATQTVNVSDKNSGYESTDTVELAISTEPIIPTRRRSPRLGGKPPGPSTAATAAVDPAPPNIDDEPQDNLDEEGSSNIPTVASGEYLHLQPLHLRQDRLLLLLVQVKKEEIQNPVPPVKKGPSRKLPKP